MGEYSKAAIIKYTRKALGMTQEELAENICDPVTLSRYENGQIDPTDEKFVRLMEKMGERIDLCTFPIECQDVEIQKYMEQLLHIVEQGEWEQLEIQRKRIEEKCGISRNYPENRQYLKRLEIVADEKRRIITSETAIAEMTEAMRETLGDCKPEAFPIRKVLTETEVLVIYDIALYNALSGKMRNSLKILEQLDQYFQRQDMINDYKPRYIIYLEYSNLLGQNGRYDESIEVCRKEIEVLRERKQMNYMYNFFFNIGWNIYEKIKKGLESKEKIPEAKSYIWVSYQLCKEYPENKSNLKIIEKYYNQVN